MRQSCKTMRNNIKLAMETGFEVIGENRPAGYSWYETARVQTHEFAAIWGIEPIVAALVLAGSSRACTVEENFRRACEFLDTGTVGFAGDYCDDLLRRWGQYGKIGSPKAHKVRAFTNNILSGDSSVVTIDRHAVSCAINHNVDTWTETTHKVVERQFLKVADEVGMVPSQVQSVAWIGWKYLKGYRPNPAKHHRCCFADFLPADYARDVYLASAVA
ncbi:MAG: DUF7178 family protein [Pirellulales bacterium]